MPTSSNDPSGSRELEYNDDRYGDVYKIIVDGEDNFVSATRLLDGNHMDTIFYASFSSLNPYHQHQIEQFLWKNKRKKK